MISCTLRELQRHTNVAREDEKVVVCEASILLGVDELLSAQAVLLLVLVLQDVEGVLEVEYFDAFSNCSDWAVLMDSVGVRHVELKLRKYGVYVRQ